VRPLFLFEVRKIVKTQMKPCTKDLFVGFLLYVRNQIGFVDPFPVYLDMNFVKKRFTLGDILGRIT
jgi:hypothetical protein